MCKLMLSREDERRFSWANSIEWLPEFVFAFAFTMVIRQAKSCDDISTKESETIFVANYNRIHPW